MVRRAERGKRSCVLGPLPPHISRRESRERDHIARLVRAVLEDDELAGELDRRATEEYP